MSRIGLSALRAGGRRRRRAYPASVQQLAYAAIGAAAGVTATAALLRARLRPAALEPAAGSESGQLGPARRPAEPGEDVKALIRQLPGCVLLARADGSLLWVSPESERLQLTRRDSLAFDDLTECLHDALAEDRVVVRQHTVWRPPLRTGRIDVRVRAIPVAAEVALLLVDDLTAEARVANVRRDFIANVSHELKTPVGAMSLLAEAIAAAADDADSVAHFAGRMQVEAKRLTNLINDVIDLSRLQGEDPLAEAEAVAVDEVVANAVDFIRSSADAKRIGVVVGGQTGLAVVGIRDQLTTALCNLLSNAVAYSAPHTQVAIAVRTSDGVVDIDVKDQGIGIPQNEQERIFERFYRVDTARSRETGGTGLGLSIVRNVCRNHGGDVSVWSVAGEGATFTMHLPLRPDDTGEVAGDPVMEETPQ